MAWREFVEEEFDADGVNLIHVLSCGHRVEPLVGRRSGEAIARRYCTGCTPTKKPERVWVGRQHIEYATAVLESLLAQGRLEQRDRAEAASAAMGAALRRAPEKESARG